MTELKFEKVYDLSVASSAHSFAPASLRMPTISLCPIFFAFIRAVSP